MNDTATGSLTDVTDGQRTPLTMGQVRATMSAPLRIYRRGVAVVLVSGAAISLTGLTGGIAPAAAIPGGTTTTIGPPPPPVIHQAPPPPPPVIHQAPPPPPVTHEAPPPPPVTHEAPPPPPPTQAPQQTFTPLPTHVPVQTFVPTTTTVAAPTTQAPRSTTAAGPLPTAIGPLPTAKPTAAASVTTSGSKSPMPSTVAQAGQTTTPIETPTTLEATPQNFELAKNSVPQVVKPTLPSQTDIQDLTKKLTLQPTSSASASSTPAVEQKSKVKQWDPKWVQTNQFYQPVIINPFPQPLQIVYIYNGTPQMLIIPPLASAIAELVQIGVYNFTAMVLDAAGIPTDVAVGTMYGGGYVPAPGEPPPPPPPPPVTYDDVPVQVQYSDATYEPFVVHQIVDAGMDPVVGEQKVLLDGVTPAWGVWQQNDNGGRLFVVHKTQQFPGMDDPPGEGPLPGDYPLQLASASKPAPSGLSTKDWLLIGAACLVLVVGTGVIILNVVLGRRQPRH
jgi:hypothetical protein